MNWARRTLGDLITLQRGHDLPEQQRRPGSVPVVGSAGPNGFHSVAKQKGPGVTVGRSGASIGKINYISEDFWPHNTCLYVTDFKGNHPRFSAYLLSTLNLGQLNSGAAQPSLNRNFVYGHKIRFPDPAEQERIANVLSAYDDLIENNRRRITLLERAVQELYREWFVRLRFPGHEHTKIVDGVPEGWTSKAVPDLIEINPATKLEKGKEVSYVPMSSLSEYGMTIDTIQCERRTKHTTVKFQNGDVLLARITPCLENGKTGYVSFLQEGEQACGSTEFIVLRGRQVSSYFTYCLARTYDFREAAIKSMIGSSGRQRVQISFMNEHSIAVPPDALRIQFDEFAKASFDQVRGLDQQNRHLVQARDLLLPRLMNGSISV